MAEQRAFLSNLHAINEVSKPHLSRSFFRCPSMSIPSAVHW
jgi:hypothetical protein